MLRSAIIYGASGLGFAGANLILARVLPTTEYAVFTLVLALVNLSFALAPAGVDGIVQRRHLYTGSALLRRTLSAGIVVALVAVLIASLAYHLDSYLLLLVFVSTVAGGATLVAGAQFQSEQRFGLSLALTQSPNLVLIVAAIVVILTGVKEAGLPLTIASAGFLVSGLTGWRILFRERTSKPHSDTSFAWKEALSFAGLNAAGILLLQLDRLIIPHVLPIEALATFGVLSAIAGSLFRVLAQGVGYTLVPRLRSATSVRERRRLVAHEARVVAVIVLGGSAAIWFLTPWIETLLLAGKYQLGGSLLLAMIFAGVAKIMNSFVRATITALATPSELWLVSVLGWASVLVALLAGVLGSRWGLAGVIYGVGFGWLTRALTASFVTLRHLRLAQRIQVPFADIPRG
jgi:O-antigen/teichoic acid export membrane protein